MVDLAYCVVNTNGREDLVTCLEAIEAVHPPELSREVLVLDNASNDGSAAMVAERFPEAKLVALRRREGKAANDSRLLASADARLCLLLNEDSELLPGSVAQLVAALDGTPQAAAAGAQLLTAERRKTACAWRLPGLATSIALATFNHRRYTVQSRGDRTRRVGWAQSSALLVRRDAAAAVGYLDPEFFVYSDETDFCKRLADAGWSTLYVPHAEAVHHDQLSTDLEGARRRLVEFHRNRARYMEKHHGRATAFAARGLGAWFYFARALAALALPGHQARRFLFQARQELLPWSGEGIAEAAAEYNRSAGV